MSTIVTRAGKGSPLTHDELDDNFTNLNTDKLENISSNSVGELSDVDITTSAPNSGEALVWDGTNFVPGVVASTTELSEDTTPVLGGQLDANGNNIINVGNIDVDGTITGGDGFGVKFPNGIDLDGAGIINSHDGSGRRISISGGQDVTLTAGGQYNSEFVNSSTTGNGIRSTIGTPGQTTTAGRLINARIATSSGYAERFTVDYTGAVTINNAYTLPVADGTDGQVLTTDGAGNLTFATPTGGVGSGLANIVEDLTPQLGGDLDTNGNNIVDNSRDYFVIGGSGASLSTSRTKGPALNTELNWDGSNRIYSNTMQTDVTLTQDVTGSNGRLRNNYTSLNIDLNGYDFTTTGGGRGAMSVYSSGVVPINNSGTPSTITKTNTYSGYYGAYIGGGDNVTIGEAVGLDLWASTEQYGQTLSLGDLIGIRLRGNTYDTGGVTRTGSDYSILSDDADALMDHAGPIKIGAYTLPNTDGLEGYVLTTNGAGTVIWGPGGSGSGGAWDGNLNGNDIVDLTDGVVGIGDRVVIENTSGEYEPLLRINDYSSTNLAHFIDSRMDNNRDANNPSWLRLRRDTEVGQSQRYEIGAILPPISTGDTIVNAVKTVETVRQVIYNNSTSAFQNTTMDTRAFDMGYIETNTIVPQPNSALMSYGVGLDAQDGSNFYYVFNNGDTVFDQTSELTNATGSMFIRRAKVGFEQSINGGFNLFNDAIWNSTGAGTYNTGFDPLWANDWRMTITLQANEFATYSSYLVSLAFPPSGTIDYGYNQKVQVKYLNPPSWADTVNRTVTLTRPASGVTYYSYDLHWFFGTLVVRDWEEFTLT